MSRAELYAQSFEGRTAGTSWRSVDAVDRTPAPRTAAPAPCFRWSSFFDELDSAVVSPPERRVFRGRGHVATAGPAAPEPARSWRALDLAPLAAFGFGCLALVGLSSALLPSATAHWADGEIIARPPVQRAFAAPQLAGLPERSRLEAFAPVQRAAIALLEAPAPEPALDRTTAAMAMAALSQPEPVASTIDTHIPGRPVVNSVEFVPASRITTAPVPTSEAAPPRRPRKSVAERPRPATTTVALAAEKPRAGGAAGPATNAIERAPTRIARASTSTAADRVADAHRPVRQTQSQAPAAATTPPAADPSPTIFSVLFPLLKPQPEAPTAFGYR